jgi:hypothetical protein
MRPTIRRAGAAFDEARFREWERELGLRFPEDYVNFLRQTNGGDPVPCDVPTRETVDRGGECTTMVALFYEFGAADEARDLASTYQVYRDRIPEGIPEGLVAIADNGSGDEFCLVLAGENRGAVVLWLHDVPADCHNIRLVAPSFGEFLDSFHDAPMPWEQPEDTMVRIALRDDDWPRLAAWIDEDPSRLAYTDPHPPPHGGKTLMYLAAIAAACECYKGLHSLGAPPGDVDPLPFVRRNAQLFFPKPQYPEVHAMASLIEDLRKR